MRIVKIKEHTKRVNRSSFVDGKNHKWVSTECEKLVTIEMSVTEIRQLKKALDLGYPHTRGRRSAFYEERLAIQKPVLDSLEPLPTS